MLPFVRICSYPRRFAFLLLVVLSLISVPAYSQAGFLPVQPFGSEEMVEAERLSQVSLIFGVDLSGSIWPAAFSNERAGLSGGADLALLLEAPVFDLVAHLAASNDGMYGPALADIPGGDLGDVYFLMDEGGVRLKAETLRFAAGRFRHYDVVDTPYSLFVNSRGIPATMLSLSYDDGFFFYESRWIGLTHDSTMTTEAWGLGDSNTGTGFPDRGANLKTYGLRLENGMRFGFQDAATYSLRYFDPEYFLNPLPQYFIQYGMATGGTPWATELDDGNMIGAFWDWKRDDNISFVAQALMDDFNLGGLFGSVLNPNQVALSVGGRMETSFGRFALYAAGATKFTFEPVMTGSDPSAQAVSAYGYTYYPETRFDYDRHMDGFQPSALEIEDNAVGYLYGENNLAIRADWKDNIAGFDMSAALEFRLMGDNSPANPWHDAITQDDNGTRWLDSDILEKRIMGGYSASIRVGGWTFSGSLSAGVAFDALELSAVDASVTGDSTWSSVDRYVWIYRPLAGNTRTLFKLTLGAIYKIPVNKESFDER